MFFVDPTCLYHTYILVSWNLKGAYREDWEGLFIRECGGDRTSHNGSKL